MEYILFCAGRDAAIVVRNLEREGKHIKYLVDNKKYNYNYKIGDKDYPVYYPTKLFEEDKEQVRIIVSSVEHYRSVVSQLCEMGFMEGKHFGGCTEWMQALWGEARELSPAYEFRIYQMAQMISEDVKSVLDLGCGNENLKKHLTEGKKYIPCDYIKHDDATIVCDLNKDDFPNVEADVIFMSGILEYVCDIEKFVDEACKHAQKEVICSYNAMEYVWDIVDRKRRGYMSHMTVMQIVDLFQKRGLKLAYSKNMRTVEGAMMKFVK